jgi:GrpB-like predicted nucleotidyltransferase (UPF0157 family)
MRKIEVVPHDPSWSEAFAAERGLLRSALGDAALAIHHIGSTSVPGLAAKPILDILVEAPNLRALDARDAAMEALGYEPMGEFGIPGRRYYRKGGDDRTHHVHAFATDDPGLARHLAFRDYLGAHPDVVAEYAALKQRVAATCEDDIERYMAGKDAFIQRVEAAAVEWAVSAPSRIGRREQPGEPDD